MWKRCSVCFFKKLIAMTTEKVFVTVMQISLLIWQPVGGFSSVSSVSLCDAYYLRCCILDCDLSVMAAHNCSPPPGVSSGCSRTSQSRVQLVEFNNFFPPWRRNAQNLQSSEVILISEQGGHRGADLRKAPYGWMGFLRGMLSVAGLNPWAMTVISAAI